jgi:hypothetical protein
VHLAEEATATSALGMNAPRDIVSRGVRLSGDGEAAVCSNPAGADLEEPYKICERQLPEPHTPHGIGQA